MDGFGSDDDILDFNHRAGYIIDPFDDDDFFNGFREEGFSRRDMDNYTDAQRTAIREKCAKLGKEDPWAYRARKTTEQRVRSVRNERVTESKEVRQANAELPPVKKASQDFKITLQQARMASGLKQKEVAIKLKVTANVVADWESGKSVPTGSQRAMLNRVLKAKLPKL